VRLARADTLGDLRSAFLDEIQHQHTDGYKSGHRTIDGFMVSSDRPDVFAIFDGEVRMTPVIRAMCQALRKLSEKQMIKVISQVVKGEVLG
jgi:hypothetical protein